MTKKLLEDHAETVEVEDLDAQFEDTPEAQDDLYDAQREILQAFDADAKDELTDHHWQVFIYRVETGGKKDTPLFTCSPIELPVYDRVTTSYGTGDYKTRIYRDHKLFRVIPFRCEAPINATPEIVSPDNSPITIALRGQQEILERMLTKISETPQLPVQNNPLEMIDIMSRLMTTVGQMMPQNIAPVTPAFDPMQMFELVIKGMEMGKDNSGGGDSNVIDLIRDVLKGVDLSAMLQPPQIAAPGQRLAAPRPEQPPLNPSRPVTPPAQPGQIPTAENAEGETRTPELVAKRPGESDPVVFATLKHLEQFIPHAQKGSEPALYADLILDNIPRATIQHVLNYPDIEEIFQASNPLVAENWSWFDALLNELRDALSEPPPAPEVLEPEGYTLYDQETLTGNPEDDTGEITGEEIQGQTVEPDQATDVSKPDEQPTPSGPNGDPERKGRDRGDVKNNVNADKGGKEKPGSKNKGG